MLNATTSHAWQWELLQLDLPGKSLKHGLPTRTVSFFRGIDHAPLIGYRTTHQDSGVMGSRENIAERCRT